MTGLLVSVRNAEEAHVACDAGADVIDVKEPTRGSLGAASPEVWRSVRDAVGRRRPVSVALGELHYDPVEENLQQTYGFRYAKVGLAGCSKISDWREQWERVIRRLPPGVDSVAVAYADWHTANSPAPAQIITHAHQLGCAAVLFDTFAKTAGNLFDHLDDSRMADLGARVQELGMKLVVGGSIGETILSRALGLAPDYIAVRGAVCRGSRIGPIDGELVRGLARQIHEKSAAAQVATEILPRA